MCDWNKVNEALATGTDDIAAKPFRVPEPLRQIGS
jgi:hypothetical protein